MRVLLGITKSNFGGAQRYVFDLATELQRAGHEVKVVCGGNGLLVDKLKETGVPTIPLPYLIRNVSILSDFTSFLFLIETLYKEHPHVFHVNSSKMGLMGVLAARVLDIPHIIFTAHGWAFNEDRPQWQKKLIKFLQWLTILFSHSTICVSEKIKTDMEAMPFVKNKLIVIHNGISPFTLLSRKEAREKLGIQNDELIVGNIAELHPIKGHIALLEAWKDFYRNHAAKLIIIGEGEERKRLEEKIQTLGIQDSVLLPGFIENARSLLSGFNIFILPSYSEGLPYTLLEAGFAQLPIIASNVGGIPEVITDEAGILTSAGHVHAITRALATLAEHPEMREKYAATIYTRVTENFALEKMVRDTLKVYAI